MLIDEATILVEAGTGGAGRVSFFPNYGKPAGGDGGKGGDVYAVVDTNLSTLTKYIRTHAYQASDGKAGGSGTKDGKDGADLILRFPVGTQLIDTATHESVELMDGVGPLLICKGGRGGWGNASVSRKNQGVFATAYPGKEGQKKSFQVIMRLIADCGLIGLPNAGKSSLLNSLTDSHAKVAHYPFTTLEPNLGVLKSSGHKEHIVIADIPGLIEGASEGKGLGDRFLRHIEKVRVLVHCISCDTPDVVADYQRIRRELAAYNPLLLKKTELVVLTKTDLYSDSDSVVQKLQRSLEVSGITAVVTLCSILDDQSVQCVGSQIASLV